MRILFDSRQTQYKTPFGTLRTGECCVLQIRIPTEVGTSGVRLMLEDSEHAVCAELPFSFASRGEDGYELWRLEFTRQETGLHFYWFRIDKRGGGSFRLFRQGSETNMEAGEKWQLSVIPADFTVPDFAPGAVMYQIFPDRFARSGSCFYGGAISETVLPAIRECDAMLFLCPNYNDAVGANFTALFNRLTSLLLQCDLSEKQLYSVIVSGYSGGDLVARQLLGAMCLNKTVSLPPRFCLLETANDLPTAQALPGIAGRLDAFAAAMQRSLCQPAGNSSEISPNE